MRNERLLYTLKPYEYGVNIVYKYFVAYFLIKRINKIKFDHNNY